MDTKIFKKATFTERLIATIIDYIILFLISLIFSQILAQEAKLVSTLSTWVVALLYSILFTWKYGQTPGKKLLKIKVVDTNYQPISFGTASLRETIGKAISGAFNLGYLWVLIDKKKQAWHDKLAHTYVVKLDSTRSLIPVETEESTAGIQKAVFAVLFLFVGFPIASAAVLLIIYGYFVQPVQIAGDSMAPNFVRGQYYLANKHAYQSQDPARGDVVIFQIPNNPERSSIKRIRALPSETVRLENGKVYVNGQILDESSYLLPAIMTYSGAFLQEGEDVTVPENSYFVLGDNRPQSSDSREYGFVPRENIVGKISICYWKCSQKN